MKRYKYRVSFSISMDTGKIADMHVFSEGNRMDIDSSEGPVDAVRSRHRWVRVGVTEEEVAAILSAKEFADAWATAFS